MAGYMNQEEYLQYLSISQLLDLLENVIKHNHYCPCECHCFDEHPYKSFNVSEIKEMIINKSFKDQKEMEYGATNYCSVEE